jgi:hypothetical protein
MKNKFYFIFFTSLALFGFFVFSCSGNSKNFYGKWQNTRDIGTLSVELSKEAWEARYENGDYYILSELSWTKTKNNDPATKNEYPNGFYIVGTVTESKNISDIQKGEQHTFTLFLNKNKTKIFRKRENLPDFVFNKTGDITANSDSSDNTAVASSNKTTAASSNKEAPASTVASSNNTTTASSNNTTRASSNRETPASDFNYRLTDNEEKSGGFDGIVITGYTGKGGALVIPEKIEGFPVVIIWNAVFLGERGEYFGPGYNITSVIIPASVKWIGSSAFYQIKKLTSVTLLGSSVTIGPGCFLNCINLSELKVPANGKLVPYSRDSEDPITGMVMGSFKGCTKLPLAMRGKLKEWGFYGV